MSDLKPCPFCGCKNILGDYVEVSQTGRHWEVICNWCMATGPEANTKGKAVELWNTRKEE